MGVIKKVLYRGQVLSRPRHRNLFLDMEENIHIHYRDLRIELSRNEFEDIAKTFNKQAAELLGIIEEKQYEDGKLPNANHEDVRIWTESRLEHDVKYHPRRISLEECGDGYHFHYRHYKLLIDPADFRRLVKLFKSIDLDEGYAESYDEVLSLLEANEIDFVLHRGNVPGSVLSLAVAKYHLPKVRDVLEYIGFTAGVEQNKRIYTGSQLKVMVVENTEHSSDDYQQMRGYSGISRLIDYLANLGESIDFDELNNIKCQVLDLYNGVKSGKTINVELDPQLWLYVADQKKVVFPYSAQAKAGRSQSDQLYRQWAGILSGLGMSFVKPTKQIFAKAHQQTLSEQVTKTLQEKVYAKAAVQRVWLMGSAARQEMGRYRSPFVHGKLAKLGSDIDIMIEIDPGREDSIPAEWHLINQEASNHCAVYHIDQIPLAEDVDGWQTKLPQTKLIHHLVDAYVHFPSRGYDEEKEAFLKKFRGQLIYDRARDGVSLVGEVEKNIATLIEEQYDLDNAIVEKMAVSTENALYKVFTAQQDYVLKLFKVAGNYSHTRVNEHTGYEADLINQLCQRDVPTAAVIQAKTGAIVEVEGWPAMLFECLAGNQQKRPEYPLDKFSAALARIHQVQLDKPLTAAMSFSFEETCTIWLDAFHDYARRDISNAAIAQAFVDLAPLAERFKSPTATHALFKRSPALHCHGDVAPKNIMLSESGQAQFFDFNNAFHGPRMVDLLDGAFEVSLAEKYIDLADFDRFDRFIEQYQAVSVLTADEQDDLNSWIALMGVVKFTKEVRVLFVNDKGRLRERRALGIANFVQQRCL